MLSPPIPPLKRRDRRAFFFAPLRSVARVCGSLAVRSATIRASTSPLCGFSDIGSAIVRVSTTLLCGFSDTGSATVRGTLTVEAALVLPLFLLFMIGAVQYGTVMETSVKFGTVLAETGRELAASAYISEYGGSADGIAGVLSVAYAQHTITKKAGTQAVKNVNMALSSLLDEDGMIDLVLTYQIKSPVAVVKLPGNYFIQRARVRAWTGRKDGSGENGGTEDKGDARMVYVAATGSVYHEDPDCTHLKLSIREVDCDALERLRNSGGGKYHACEKCGSGAAADTVYITNEGDRYHNSLTCSGLKRTVSQVSLDDCALRPCSKCSGG